MSGAVPLVPVPSPSGETVLWSSIPPAPDAKAAAAARAHAAAAAAAGVPAPEDSSAGAAAAAEEGEGRGLFEQELFSDPQLPPPIKVTVKAGEALYLPAMWWHQVSCSGANAAEPLGVGESRRDGAHARSKCSHDLSGRLPA